MKITVEFGSDGASVGYEFHYNPQTYNQLVTEHGPDDVFHDLTECRANWHPPEEGTQSCYIADWDGIGNVDLDWQGKTLVGRFFRKYGKFKWLYEDVNDGDEVLHAPDLRDNYDFTRYGSSENPPLVNSCVCGVLGDG